MKSLAAVPAPGVPQRPLGERVYQLLLARIRHGDYAADRRLPTENELSSQFHVSRPVVRAALERLRTEGLIHSRRGSGSFVRVERPGLGFAPVESVADIQRCYEFRLTLEPDASFHAARRRNGAILDRLAALIAALEDATLRQEHSEETDFAFHLTIAEGANNHYYTASLEALKHHVSVGMKLHGLALMGPKPALAGVLAEHVAIFNAIRSGDAEAARENMRLHLEGSLGRLFEGRSLDLSL